jgi:hypothetical protein
MNHMPYEEPSVVQSCWTEGLLHLGVGEPYRDTLPLKQCNPSAVQSRDPPATGEPPGVCAGKTLPPLPGERQSNQGEPQAHIRKDG